MIKREEFLQKWDECAGLLQEDKNEHLSSLGNKVADSLSLFTENLDLASMEAKIRFSNTMITSIIGLQRYFSNINYTIDEAAEEVSSQVVSVAVQSNFTEIGEQESVCNLLVQELGSKIPVSEVVTIKSILFTYTESGYDISFSFA